MIDRNLLVILPKLNFNEDEFLSVKRVFEQACFRLFISSDAQSLCTGQNGLRVSPDMAFLNINHNNFAAAVIIGGNGIKTYWDSSLLHSKLQSFNDAGKPIGAICSAPVLLAKAGILNNREATCYPEDKDELVISNVIYKDMPVVEWDNIITANGPAAAVDFANGLVDKTNKQIAARSLT